MTINTTNIESLKLQAKAAAAQAYAPYSGFKVGAVLVSDDDKTVSGCNVENVSYGLSNCAERTAIFCAIANGMALNEVKQVVIYTPSDEVYSPCGACRQVMTEFLAPTTLIISCCETGAKQWTLAELLPDAFSFNVDDFREPQP